MIFSRGFSKPVSLLVVVLVIGAVIGVCAYYFRHPLQTAQSPTLPTSTTQTPTSTQPSNLPNLSAGWTTYTDQDFHLSFGYPATWTGGTDSSGYTDYHNSDRTNFL